jgi:hypothetical protein
MRRLQQSKIAIVKVSFSVTLLPLLLCVAGIASAKTPTVKITVSGGGLTTPIELTDAQLLSESNVWSGEFLDPSTTVWSSKPLHGVPERADSYELSFDVTLADSEAKRRMSFTTIQALRMRPVTFTCRAKETAGTS